MKLVDVVELVTEHCGDRAEALGSLVELAEQVKRDGYSAVEESFREIYSIAENERRCPECFREAQVNKWDELYCDRCDWRGTYPSVKTKDATERLLDSVSLKSLWN